MKAGFLLLLFLSIVLSVFAVERRSRRVFLEENIPLTEAGLEIFERGLAKAQNPSDPEYEEYRRGIAAYRFGEKAQREALERYREEYERVRRQVLPVTVAALVCWAVWLGGYVMLLRRERRFVARFNRSALRTLFTIAGLVVGYAVCILAALPFGYGAGGIILMLCPVTIPLFAFLGNWAGRRTTRRLVARTTFFA